MYNKVGNHICNYICNKENLVTVLLTTPKEVL